MALPFPPIRPYNPIPNNPFYYPESYTILGAYSPYVVGSGLSVSPSGVISATGGGGGGAVSSVNAGAGISVSSTTGAVTVTNAGVTSIVAGAGIQVSASTGSITISAPSAGVSSVTGVAPINVTSGAAPSISISPATTTSSGAVQLYNGVNSTSPTLALTAAQGKILQDQITALTNAGNLELAGTLNAATGKVASVTSIGSSAGFIAGNSLPVASSSTNNLYVIVTAAGTITPPGGVPTAATQGDWFVVTETLPGTYIWSFLNVGFDAPYATSLNPGIVCLSTPALAQAGTDTTTALTPADVAAVYIPKACITGKGAVLTGTGASAPVAISVGTDGQALVACSTASAGLAWANICASPATPGCRGVVYACTENPGPTTLGFCAGANLTSGTNNVAIGYQAMVGSTTADDNVAVGIAALRSLSAGCFNVAVGGAVMPLAFGTVIANTGVGYRALGGLGGAGFGSYNTALGYSALLGVTCGCKNVGIGSNVCVPNPAGNCQLAIGFGAGQNWISGDCNKHIQPGAGIRDCAGNLGTSGQVLSSTGSAIQWVSSNGIPVSCVDAKGSLITGSAPSNVCSLSVGVDGQVLVACAAATTGLCWITPDTAFIPCSILTAKGDMIVATTTNTPSALAVGATGQYLQADAACTPGVKWGDLRDATRTCAGVVTGITTNSLTALGLCAAGPTGTGADSVFIGYQAGCSSTSVGSVAVGTAALQKSTGNYNTAIGLGALRNATSGGTNTAIGTTAGQGLATGIGNVFVGHNAAQGAIPGATSNTIVGAVAGNAAGNRNTIIGNVAGQNAGSAMSDTVLIGFNAGGNLVSCGCQVIVGSGSYGAIASTNVLIGQGLATSCNNHVVIGRGGQACATFALAVGFGWSFTSDARVKDGVTALSMSGESFINALNPVSYCYLDRETKKPLAHKHCNVGFIAQDVEKVLEDFNLSHVTSLITRPVDPDDHYQMSEAGLVPFLVKAVQELSSKVAELEKKVGHL